MNIALIGSHGTGKTTVFNRLKNDYPQFHYLKEGVRVQMPGYGYKNPYDFIDQFGIGVFEVMNINSWTVIDPQLNTLIDKTSIIMDRSTIDNYAYYLALRETELDFKLEPLLKKMAYYFTEFVDLYVYFPINVIPLVNDEMRIGDQEYQKKIDESLKQALKFLEVDQSKIHHLLATTVDNRVNEIISLIK
jgi:thymidylate kinase